MRVWRHGLRWGVVVVAAVCVLGRVGFGLDPHQGLDQYGRQVWETDNGLPQNTVHVVVQGRDGYVWIGTDDGLVRFDGNEFKVFTVETTPELGGSAVLGLTVDRGGRVWVVTSGGLAVWMGGVEAHVRGSGHGAPGGLGGGFERVGVGEGLAAGTVWFVHEDSRGRVWVATAGGLCVMQEGRCEAVAAGLSVNREGKFAEAGDGSVWVGDGDRAVRLDAAGRKVGGLRTIGGAEILALLVGRDGRLVVGTAEGLEVERGGVLAPVAIGGRGGRVAVNAMLAAADGTVWLGTSAGLARGSGERFGWVAGEVGLGAVQMLFPDREGAVWAGTARGVARVVEGRVEEFRAGDALAGGALLAMMEDREGNVWLGTEADGLTMLHEQRFTTYTTAEGLSGNVVRSVLEDGAGMVWVGTDGAGLNRRAAGASGFKAVAGLSSGVVLALAAGVDGDLWVGTPTGLNVVGTHVRESGHGAPGGVSEIRGGGGVRVLTTADGLADDFIRSLLVDRRGEVWVGTRHGLTRIAAGGGMTTYTALDGLGSDFIGVMVEGREGELWVGTSGGLTRLSFLQGQPGKFTNFKVRDGLAKNVVTAIHEDGAGVLWLGTSGGGLMRLDARTGGEIVPVGAGNLPQAISSVLEDGEGRLWIGSRAGIVRVEIAALNRAMETHAGNVALTGYDTSDGMRVRECSSGGHPAAVRLRDGTMAFATLRGLSVVDPEHLRENAVPPLVAIETVLVNDVAQAAGAGLAADGAGELVLAPGSQRVEFRYAGLSFVAPQKVEYRYWLEGFDRYWVEAGAHRAAFYTNLRPGRYVFHVAAANNDGVWSEVDGAVRLRVWPFFWQTWWFYGLMVLMAAGLAYLIYARRVRRVEALYQGVMAERGRIAREIHDTLAQGIVSISLQLEVVTRLMGTSVEAARAQLDQTRALVRQSLAEARSSIWELRAEAGTAEAEELPVRLGRAVKALTDGGEATGKLTVTGSYRAIAREVEDELLRIGQEAVTNAVRHAGGARIEVVLTYDMRRVRLEVRDDGRGFDAAGAEPVGHFGLQGMRERAAKIGAKLEVRSEVGNGTVIVVERGLS